MFFVHDLEHRIDLHPSFFSSTASDFIRAKLYQDVEGTNTGTHLIVAVLSIDEISEPKIAPGTGFAQYNVGYRALVWRPFRGEVVDGKVTDVVPTGIFLEVGGLTVFVSKTVWVHFSACSERVDY
jgi:DNA-directed RNA polymerase II subunit RPB7